MPHFIGKSGIHWHYNLEGEGEDVLFFIHGWGVDHRIWKQQTKHFAQFNKILTIDLPGHGKSSWVKVPLAEMADDVGHLVKELGIERFKVIGSSLGGLLALKMYSLYPEKFNQIVFVGSMPKFSKSADYPYGLDVAQMRKLGGQLNVSYPSIVNIFFRSLFTYQERESRRFRWLVKFRQTEDTPMRQALSEYLDILENEDLRDDLKRINVPTQFINGSEDQICTRATVEYLRTLIPQARVHYFDDCGHFPFLSKPHEFNQILGDFLLMV